MNGKETQDLLLSQAIRPGHDELIAASRPQRTSFRRKKGARVVAREAVQSAPRE
jgi:hypothetical protein